MQVTVDLQKSACIMEDLLPTIPELLEKYYPHLKFILSCLFLFGSGLLLAKVWEYKKRPKLEYQEKAAIGSSVNDKYKQEEQSIPVAVVVNVSGAVKKPGVYSLETGARGNDALEKAGGLAESADKDWVSRELNLASKLNDGEKVYIPEEGEVKGSPVFGLVAESVERTAGEKEFGSTCPAQININTASLEILTCLYNVGEKRAQEIIDYRSKTPFGSVEEITNIKGIGEKTLERIRERITVN